MEHEILVKSEMETANGELLVFYVDENGTTEQGVITSIENIEDNNLEQEINYIVQDDIEVDQEVLAIQDDQLASPTREKWTEEDTKRLLMFYVDNKGTFVSGTTKKKQLWAVACKTMLTGKNPSACEIKLRNLKKTYSVLRVDQAKGKTVHDWPYYDLCHQGFHDDSYIEMLVRNAEQKKGVLMNMHSNTDGIVSPDKLICRTIDEKVEQMLNLYLKHKTLNNDHYQKHLWDIIAIELGENGDYWHRRFLNFKQHYIKMLEKRKASKSETISWPYMRVFDEIYANDISFQKKYGGPSLNRPPVTVVNAIVPPPSTFDWDDTEKTVLIKYCFDCFDEFRDNTIPKNFLWNEIGRLLDKTPDICKKKYEELKLGHLCLYISGEYDLRSRTPIAILFDNLLCLEVQVQFSTYSKKVAKLVSWSMEEIDTLVKYFFDNLEMFKDPICHFVCWAAVGMKLGRNVASCKYQWTDLTMLYKSILDDKKEDPEMEIDWRYIELFDRIFDYGMDMKLLQGYETTIDTHIKSDIGKIAVKKVHIKTETGATENDDIEEYDERGFVKRSRGIGDLNQFAILEYYQKNKDKFAASQNKKQALWRILARQMGITAEQCAHRFRNLKQVYTAYVQREVNKPEIPILWPYYTLCKKVFGYRAVKSRLKNVKTEKDIEEWSAKEIKQVISYFGANFTAINTNPNDASLWSALASEMNHGEGSCHDKFMELMKSYSKVKKLMVQNPSNKVTWKYFKLFEEICTGTKIVNMEVDSDDEDIGYVASEEPEHNIKSEHQEDDDYQCIIVLPEGAEETNNTNAEIIIQHVPNETTPETPTQKTVSKWNLKSRKLMLNLYLNYLKAKKGTTIDPVKMWREIASGLSNKSALACKRSYIKMKTIYKEKMNDEEYKSTGIYNLFKQISALKPKFIKPPVDGLELDENKVFTDVDIAPWKVLNALKYYLEHLDEFLNPRYETRYVWKELSTHASIGATRAFQKINYLKQLYRNDINDVDVEYREVLKLIFEREFAIKIALATEPVPTAEDDSEVVWSDDETEQLLLWYLQNLSKFKNPKFVPSYLWMDASNVLEKSALACSKKMSEIRTQYSSMVKEDSHSLAEWRFYELCQKIYGTGKKSTPINSD